MSEAIESPEAGTDPGPGVDPAALAFALGSASRSEADAFLRNQNSLIDLQKHHLREQFKHLRLTIWEKRAGVLLRLATAVVGIVVAGFLGAVVWNAAHADGLIVESFKVSPDLADKGLTGEVVASRLLDELSAMQAQSIALRAPTSYANNWGDDLKVEIPETGVSLGEVYRYLRSTLGHETHISGEVVQLDSGGVEVTVRAGSDGGESVIGNTADFHALLKKAAAAIYARTQPYRYTNILSQQGRIQEEEALALAHTQTGPAAERAWAYSTLGATLALRNHRQEALRALRASVAINPDFAYGWYRIGQLGINGEEIVTAVKKSLSLVGVGTADLVPETVAQLQSAAHRIIAVQLGDYDEAVRREIEIFPMVDFSADPPTQFQQAQTALGGGKFLPIGMHTDIAQSRVGQHDLAAARRLLAQEPAYIAAFEASSGAAADVRGQLMADRAAQPFRNLELVMALETGDWGRIKQLVPGLEAETSRFAKSYAASIYPPAILWPALALAEAETGDFAAAHALIDRTPSACDRCLVQHARIDALQKNYGGADYWFARAEHLAPSIPFADEEWGRVLLARGDAAGAIEKFKASRIKGPHFADPLEGWGEALMARNQSHLALAKFAEADKYAPNWGRLHLKWGEALIYAGKKDEGRAHFIKAGSLDLTPSEKSELARLSHV